MAAGSSDPTRREHATLASMKGDRYVSKPIAKRNDEELAETVEDRVTDRRDDRTLVIATVMESTPEGIASSIRRARLDGADAVEVRLDAAPAVDPEQIGAPACAGPVPLIATCRSIRDGGTFTGSEDERVAILERAARTGRFRLDVEWGSPADRLRQEHPEWVAVLSHHDCERTPDDLDVKARALLAAATPGQIVKLVTTARKTQDILTIRNLLRGVGRDQPGSGAEDERDRGVPGVPWKLARRPFVGRGGASREMWPHESRAPRRLAAFAMGDRGRPSRVLASAWGSAAVWAAADASRPGAPGQIDVGSLLGLYRARDATPRTRVFAVAGSPVSGSLSPAVHNEGFRRLGLDAVYVALECDSISELEVLIDELPLDGVSITAPLKVEAVRLLDDADVTVRKTGSCNTIVVKREAIRTMEPRWCGFNTDGGALLEEVRLRLDPAGREATVVGAGGAARSAAHALVAAGSRVTIAARDAVAGGKLAKEVGGAFRPISGLEPSPDGILIQATSAPLDDPVVPEGARRAALLIDMRYGSREGALQVSATRLGTPAVDGVGMLVRQARAQLRLFTGLDVPFAVLLDAAENARRKDRA